MRADARLTRAGRDRVGFAPATQPRGPFMNSIVYIVGLVVIIAFILGFFGLR
jgi:hypothetical protein